MSLQQPQRHISAQAHQQPSQQRINRKQKESIQRHQSAQPVADHSLAAPLLQTRRHRIQAEFCTCTRTRNWLHRLALKVCVLLDHPATLLAVLALTLLALFLEDIRLAFLPPKCDLAIYVISTCIFAAFAMQLVVNIICRPRFVQRLECWLDAIAVLSLIPDIPWLWNPIIGLDAEDSLTSAANIAIAFKMSRATIGLARVIRLARLVRLVRIAKLFEVMAKRNHANHRRQQDAKALANAQQLQQQADEANQGHGGGASGAPAKVKPLVASPTLSGASGSGERPSQVGQHLSEQTTRKVVLLVLVMLFGIPLLQPHTEEHAEDYSLRELDRLASPAVGDQNSFRQEIAFIKDYYRDVLYLSINAPAPYQFTMQSPSLDEYRTSEVKAVDYLGQNQITSLFSIRSAQQQRGLFSFVTTLIVLFLLVVGSVLFNRNNHKMVIIPIERMMATIVSLQQNPLAKASLGSDMQQQQIKQAAKGTGAQTILNTQGQSQDCNKNNTSDAMANNGGMQANLNMTGASSGGTTSDGQPLSSLTGQVHHTNETGMLERTLEKLTGLLQVGFGEAGNAMIQKCMNLNADGDLDPLVDGTKMLALFGFCDIRRFTDATECLKEDVMMYVNEIAAIVHSQVNNCQGNPNKNIGDAFLLVWRLPQELDADDLTIFTQEQQANMNPNNATGNNNNNNAAATLQQSNATKSPPLSPGGPQGTHKLAYKSTMESSTGGGASTTPRAAPQHRKQTSKAMGSPRQSNPSSSAMVTQKPRLATNVSMSISPQTRMLVSQLADKALVSFLRIMTEIAASTELKKYALNPRIAAAFDDFEVQLGFGLHCGWAIEGPIGSRYKIDASYLSPHVNLAEALEGTTKVYGVPLLVSGEFYSLLSPYIRCYCRRIDCVKVSGRETKMNLYTFDITQQDMDNVINPNKRASSAAAQAAQATAATIELVGATQNRPTGQQHQRLQSRQSNGDPNQHVIENSGVIGGNSQLNQDDETTSPSSHSPEMSATGDDETRTHTQHHHHHNKDANENDKVEQSNNKSALHQQAEQHLSPVQAVPSVYVPPPPPANTSKQVHIDRVQHQGPVPLYHMVRSSLVSALQTSLPLSFFEYHQSGIDAYILGDWTSAHYWLQQALGVNPTDEPTKVILDFIREHNFVAPPQWQGFRELA